MRNARITRNLIALPILLCCATTAFSASTSTSKIGKMLIDNQRQVIYLRVKNPPNDSPCRSKSKWHYMVDGSNPAYYTILETLAEAKEQKLEVTIVGTDVCDDEIKVEKIDRVTR